MQADTTAMPVTKRPSAWKIALNIALPLLLIAIFLWQAKKSLPYIKTFDWHQIDVRYVALAVLLLLINSALEILIWNRTLSWFTDALPFRLATPVYIWSSLARYIPGKIASLIIRVTLATEVKRDVVPVLASSTVELALRTASGLLFMLVAMLVWGIAADRSKLAAILVIVPLVLICAHPRIMTPSMNLILRKMKKEPITRALRYRDVLLIFVATMVRWLFYGLAFAMLACALSPGAAAHVPVLIGTASGSWGVGFISLSPGGFGAAEIVQQKMLQTVIGLHEPLPTIIPILFRLATLTAEGMWALLSVALWRKRS